MNATLHLTNGSAIIPNMRDAGVMDPIVPWDDVLHEGPVPSGLNAGALRERRAEFLASCGWGSRDDLCRSLAARDRSVEQAMRARPDGVDEIVLWFEHDLYDQLQVLQILDRVPLDGTPRITAVPDAEYLGHMPVAHFPGLLAARREITSNERLAARDAWTAFRAPDPSRLVEVLPRVSVLQHLEPALLRHLQQFPSIDNGLSRTEHQALEAVAAGVQLVRDVYVQSHHLREEAVFMGDAAFVVHVAALLKPPVPLLRTVRGARELTLADQVELTDEGREVLEGRADRVATCGIDRWLGGVQLSGIGPVWRWDPAQKTVRFA